MKFRKRPVEVEAELLENTRYSKIDILACIYGIQEDYSQYIVDGGIIIKTLEGDVKASYGDWIIKGVNGEFYPCKPDIFSKTYEPIK